MGVHKQIGTLWTPDSGTLNSLNPKLKPKTLNSQTGQPDGVTKRCRERLTPWTLWKRTSRFRVLEFRVLGFRVLEFRV